MHPGAPSTTMQWGFHPHVSYLKTVLSGQQPCKLKVIVKWLLKKSWQNNLEDIDFIFFEINKKSSLPYTLVFSWLTKVSWKTTSRLWNYPRAPFEQKKNLLSRTRRRRWQGSLAWSLMFLSLCQFDFWSFWRWMVILFYWHRQCQSRTKAWNHCFYFLSYCALCVRRRGHWVLHNTKAGYLNCKIKTQPAHSHINPKVVFLNRNMLETLIADLSTFQI